MAKVSFKDQVVEVDMLQSVEWLLEAGERVTNAYLARAVEASTGRPLPPKLLQQVAAVVGSAPEKRRKGPKGMSPAKLDHLMTHVDRLYDLLRARYSEQDKKSRAETKLRRGIKKRLPPVRQRAYSEILRRMRADFPNRDWTLLKNQHSKWRNRKWDPPESGNEHPDD
jgi:hypothetical protein